MLRGRSPCLPAVVRHMQRPHLESTRSRQGRQAWRAERLAPYIWVDTDGSKRARGRACRASHGLVVPKQEPVSSGGDSPGRWGGPSPPTRTPPPLCRPVLLHRDPTFHAGSRRCVFVAGRLQRCCRMVRTVQGRACALPISCRPPWICSSAAWGNCSDSTPCTPEGGRICRHSGRANACYSTPCHSAPRHGQGSRGNHRPSSRGRYRCPDESPPLLPPRWARILSRRRGVRSDSWACPGA
mmetsp:Transcript_22554/g.65566  ORF Transcript_22554/g.65566 Transcript_22554/m.65566 type:complete len:240 (-) Transcript_22554:407-1126(-)